MAAAIYSTTNAIKTGLLRFGTFIDGEAVTGATRAVAEAAALSRSRVYHRNVIFIYLQWSLWIVTCTNWYIYAK